MPERIVIALGGNALQSGNSAPTAEAQLEVVKKTSERIAEISRRGYEMAVVHGNGPQVGRIVLAGEAARDVVPPMPFDVCGAMSQGYIGLPHSAIAQVCPEQPGAELPRGDAGDAGGGRSE